MTKIGDYHEFVNRLLTRMDGAIGGGKFVSLHSAAAYLGACESCPDQCGVLNPLSTNLKESQQ